MIEKAVYSRLAGASAITNLVSTRIYSLERPQVSDLPCIIFTRLNTERDDVAHSGAMGAATAIVSVTAYGESFVAVQNISEQIRLLFHTWKGTAGSVVVLFSRVVNESPLIDSDLNLKSLTLDLELTYQEATM